MSRMIVVALLVALAAVASASAQYGYGNNFGYSGHGYGGNYNPYSNFNFNQYPNIQQGYGFYNQQPFSGYSGCTYWCKSYNNQYYCCTNAGNVHGFNSYNSGYNNGYNNGYNQWG